MSKAIQRIATATQAPVFITSQVIGDTTIAAVTTIGTGIAMSGITANRSAALRRWRAPPGHIATSGAAWVCPACRACRDELLLSPFGRQQHAFDTELLEPGLGGFSFLTGPERSDLNAGFERGRNTAQEQLGV